MAKGICVEKIQLEGLGTVQVFLQEDGTYDGWSFSKGKYVPDPYKNKPADYAPVVVKKSAAQIKEELDEIDQYLTLALPDRKLKKETLEYFGVKIGVSEEDGQTPTLHYYPYTSNGKLVAYKARVIKTKQMWSVGAQSDVDLFGWEKAIATGSQKLFITEGEIDAMSLHQILLDSVKGTKWEGKIVPAVVSLAHGCASAAKDLGKLKDKIYKQFKEVVLVFDQDEPGKKAVESVLRVLPDVLVAEIPGKDVNECLMEGKIKACNDAVVFRGGKPKNTRIVSASSLHELAKVPPEFGVSWPWNHITEATRGIRKGETIYIGAAQKMGKSEVVNTLAAHFMKRHNWKVFLAKPEESNIKSYKLVAGKMVGKIFHDPKVPFDDAAYEEAGKLIGDKLYLLNLYQNITWEVLEGDIRAAAAEGCEAIFIDPITNLTNGMAAADANVKLQEIAQKLAAMALDLNVVIFIFCHLRNPDSGLPHERGGNVLSSQFAGSRAMARSCNLMLGLEGNRDPDLDEVDRNCRTLVLLEDREYGESGKFGLYWDNKTGLFNEL